MSAAFAAAADAWTALLAKDGNQRFLETHLESVLAMAVALAQPNAENAIDWAAVRETFNTEEDEQTLLALVFAIQDVIEAVVRENIVFIIDEPPRRGTAGVAAESDQPSASQRDTAAQQEALVQRLPEGFRLAFITTLRTHWSALRDGAAQQNVALNTLSNMDWRVVRPYVILRVVTSDNKRRIIKVPMKQFHQLRYSAAKVLQEMSQVETHPIMRLTKLKQDSTHERTTRGSAAP